MEFRTYSPTRLLALPRPLAGGQGHLGNGLRYVFLISLLSIQNNVPLLAAYYTDDSITRINVISPLGSSIEHSSDLIG